MNKLLVFFFGFLATQQTLTGCATSSSSRALPPAQEDPSLSLGENEEESQSGDHRAFRNIREAYSKRQWSQVSSLANRFKKQFPKSALLPQVLNIEGLVFLDQKETAAAQAVFQKAIQTVDRSDRLYDYILYNLATTLYQSDRFGDAMTHLEPVRIGSLDQNTRVKFFYLKSLVQTKLGQNETTIRTLLEMDQVLGEPVPEKMREHFLPQLRTALEAIPSWGTLETILKEFPKSSFNDEVFYRLGNMARTQGDWDRSAHYFRTIVGQFPQSPHYSDATDFLSTMEQQSIVDRKLVGLLLPMSGKYSKFGQNSLEAIALAFRIHDLNRKGESQVQLIIEDAGETPEQALSALNKLFFEHHVVAVLGPLLGKDSQGLFQRAQDLGLPILTLTQKGSSPGNYVFHTSASPEIQAQEIAKYAIEEQGLKRFAIAYPNDSFGKEYMNAFWDAAEGFGGEIVAAEEYTSRQTDFRTVVDKLSGLFYLGARQRESDELERIRKSENITKRSSRTEAYFRLPPIRDYDAVFIPDEARTVAQILPTFAYRDVDDVSFLGISTWNSPLLLRRANEQLPQSFFVDMFFMDDPHPSVRRFVSQFERIFQRAPSALEAQAYDAALILEHAMLSSSSTLSRSELRDRLMMVQQFAGVTGKLSYRDGRFDRVLKVLHFEKGAIKQIR